MSTSPRRYVVLIACLVLVLIWLFTSFGKQVKLKTTINNDVVSTGQRYKPKGKPFNVSRKLLRSIGLPPSQFTDNSLIAMKQFVVATGSSRNHFKESFDAIASVQANMPGRPIYYYDLGLTDSQVQEIQSWCSVYYRKFDFTRYPSFVKDLYKYAWKPLIIQDMLRDHAAVLWIDASFRWLSPNLTFLYDKAIDSDGFLVFGHTGHSTFAVTSGGMYQYLITNIEAQKRTAQYGATGLFVANTRTNYRDVLWWYYLCALTEKCISPGGGIACRFKKDRMNAYAGCHRFDQSLANILLANRWRYNVTHYTLDMSTKLFTFIRHSTKLYSVAVCKGHATKHV